MAGRGITMQIDAPGGLQDAVHMFQPLRHVRKVRHAGWPYSLVQARYGVVSGPGNGAGKLIVPLDRLRIPVPSVVKRPILCPPLDLARKECCTPQRN